MGKLEEVAFGVWCRPADILSVVIRDEGRIRVIAIETTHGKLETHVSTVHAHDVASDIADKANNVAQ